MMRTSLFHRAEPRHLPRGTRALPRLRRGGPVRVRDAPADATPQAAVEPPTMDALGRAQAAGGPLDQATYVCGCGYLFSASVSTTVACPHCGAEQAW